MTLDRDTERLLDAWFAEGPAIIADRVIDDTAARISRTTQRPAWRLHPWRFPTMSTPFKLVLVGAVLVAVLVGGAALMAGGGVAPAPTPSPSPTASATATPTVAPSTAAWWQVGVCGSCAGDLVAGTHTSVMLRPALTFTVPQGWVNNYDQADGYQLIRDNADNRACLGSDTPTCQLLSVNRDMRVGALDCSTATAAGATFDAARIVAALSARPGLAVTNPVNVTVGRLHGLQFDLALRSDWSASCPDSGDTPSVATFTNGSAHWSAVKGARSRFTLIDLPASGNVLVEVWAASGATLDAALADATPIIESFQFSSGG